jgi:hypothetical protein
MKDYAVYKGDELLCFGNVNECAKYLGVLPDTVRFYASAKYLNRVKKRKNASNYTIVIKIEDDE